MLTRLGLVSTRSRNGVRDRIDMYHDRSGYLIRKVDGLGPPDAVVSYTEHAMVPGGSYNASSIQSRNIVITTVLTPTPEKSIRELREDLYRVVSPGRPVSLRLYNDFGFEFQINGYTETVEPNMFEKDPVITVSIICTNPYFESFVNETGLMQPGQLDIDYEGTAKTGLRFYVRFFNNDVNLIDIQDENLESLLRIPYDYRTGMRLSVDTRVGSKSIILTRSDGSRVANLLGRATVIKWPELDWGTNRIVMRPRGDLSAYEWSLTYQVRYEGF